MTPTMKQWATSQAQPEVVVNENFKALQFAAVYGPDQDTTTGLTWGYLGGRWGGFAVTAGTLTLTASQTNYVVVLRSSGVISTSTTITNWNNDADYARVFLITTGASTVTAVQDHRAGEFGIFAGGSGGGGGGAVSAPLITESGASHQFDPTEDGSYIRYTATGAKTGNFNSTDSFASPQEFHVANRATSGNVTLSGTGVTLNSPKGGSLVLEPGDTVTVKFVSSTVADVFGSTEAA